eukprot:jgi/Astpho2/9328/e_gw1.00142.42.1_t
MDWSNVSLEDLVNSLQEVDWTQRPRPIGEFFSCFNLPPSPQKLQARLNDGQPPLLHCRTNYALIIVAALGVALLRNPGALVACGVCLAAALCLNDTFATTLSDRLLRLLRQVQPRWAQKIRSASGGHSGYRAPGRGRREVKICAVPRTMVVGGLAGLGLLLMYWSRALLTLAWALVLGEGDGAVLLHAALRQPNLKARLASARDEFRAVWRGYQDPDMVHDYNL